MKIANEFTVGVPIDRAWAVLTDLEGIAPCLPGAQLTGVDGDVYRGKVKVKVGPVISEFAGTARFAEKDGSAYRAVIDAKGRDARSAGNAAAMITAQLRPAGDSTVVSVDTDMKISGKLAQFGSGMIKEVSEKLLGQFVASLESKIAADDAAGSGTPTGGSPAGTAPGMTAAGSGTPTGGSPAGTAPGATAPAGDVVPPAGAAPTAGPGAGDPTPPAGGAPAAGTARDDDAQASVAAARTVSGDEAPLSAASGEKHPDTPSLSPGGEARLATVPDAKAAAGTEFTATAEPEPLDLMQFAGGSIRKRVVPLAVGAAVVVAAVVIWRLVR